MSAGDQVGEPQPVEHEPSERELLREEIEQVREDLGETVQALAHKADLKGQVHDKVEDTRAQVQDRVEGVKAQLGGGGQLASRSSLRGRLASPAAPGALAAVCAVLLLRAILRSRR